MNNRKAIGQNKQCIKYKYLDPAISILKIHLKEKYTMLLHKYINCNIIYN